LEFTLADPARGRGGCRGNSVPAIRCGHEIALFMTAIKEQREANNRALGELTLTIKDMQNSINVRMGGIEQAMRDHVAEGDTRPRRNKTGYNQP
jgi:hypothetical protein